MADAARELPLHWDDDLPPFMRFQVRTAAGGGVLAGAFLVGILGDQALRSSSSGIGLGASLALAAAALVLVAVAGVKRWEPRLLAAGAVFFAAWLCLRASPWLAWPDLAACLLLLGAAASLAIRGSLFDLGLLEAGARILHGCLQLGAGAVFAAPPVAGAARSTRLLAPVARGLLIGLPIAGVLALLLAAADPIFASFFVLDLDYGQLAQDGLLVLLGALATAGLLRLAGSVPLERIEPPGWRLGLVEGLTVLAVLDAVFAAFAVAQAIAVTTTDYAEYARTGFFELLWAAGITLVVLLFFGRITAFSGRRGHRAFVALAELAIALTLLVVAVAFQRLSLYEAVYGFTMLRLYSHLFAVLVGVAFLYLAAELAGLGRGRRWFLGAASMTALALLACLNLAGPEALVVGWNLDRATASGKLDVSYLGQLSSDAVPGLVAGRTRLDPGLQLAIAKAVCQQQPPAAGGWAAWNLAAGQAADARRSACPTPLK